MTLVFGLGAAMGALAAPPDPSSLTDALHRAGERVERYFARAQSIVCLEIVRWLPLTSSWGSDGIGRTVESELRLSWEPGDDGSASIEAQALRQLLRVNGRPPRKNDRNNCTDPEQQRSEPHPLSMLLPARRGEYAFTLVERTRLDGRTAIVIDYKLLRKVTVESSLVDDREDCLNYNVDGGRRGRLWIDAETSDVLRLDEALGGMVDVPLPKKATRPPGAPSQLTLERSDTSIRFKPVTFKDPDETIVLPVSMSSLRVTRGWGESRLRMITDYTKYQRFLTGGRIVGQ